MVKVAPNRNIIGKKLGEPIYTSNGRILFTKGHTFTEEDLTFLQAFKIETVMIEPQKYAFSNTDIGLGSGTVSRAESGTTKAYSRAGAPSPGDEGPDFFTLYEKASKQMEKIMWDVSAGSSIPLMEVRNWLRPLIDQVLRPSGWIMALQPYQGNTNYTYYHMVSVALLSAVLAKANRFAAPDIMQIALAGLLSDIGKSKVDQRILMKAGPLNTEEYNEVKTHTWLGYQVLKGIKGLSEGVALAALQHHERIDGSGYPLGVKGDKIHPYAKIVAIADVLHAMSSIRVYRDRESPIRAIEHIRYENVGKFDPGIVHRFLHSIAQLPLGTQVKLNDGRIGKLIYVDANHPTRPMIDLKGEIIALTDHYHLFIEEILK